MNWFYKDTDNKEELSCEEEMIKKAKIALQIVGLAIWTAAWLGGGSLILNKLFPVQKKKK